MRKVSEKEELTQPSLEVKSEEVRGNCGRFSIEPLERGYGHTLGSALRRVLLLGLPGASITSIKISGLRHQFDTIKGVKEDGVDLLLNLKQVKVAYDGEKETKLTIRAKGKGEVKAGDIKVPVGVEIVNPDLIIATLADNKSKLDVDMFVQRGVGYSASEERKTNIIGLLPLDADFSPITRVKYKVEETRVGRLTNYDKLTIEIWTNGAINPQEALKSAATILVSHLQLIILPGKGKKKAGVAESASAIGESLSVEELGLPTRIANALVKAGYEMAGDLVRAKRVDLVKTRNLGEKSVRVIEETLKIKGIRLA